MKNAYNIDEKIENRIEEISLEFIKESYDYLNEVEKLAIKLDDDNEIKDGTIRLVRAHRDILDVLTEDL